VKNGKIVYFLQVRNWFPQCYSCPRVFLWPIDIGYRLNFATSVLDT